MTHEPTRHSNTLIFPASLDPDAVTVVNRLNEAGLESYFVGGCVRDLLLGLIPKDFDISTAARPRQIRRLFRNSRIIGRRFKLAHVHFGRKIIEVATFRRTPEGTGEPGVEPPGEGEADDLLITRDNEFGTAEQDAVRRDFTINALLYDVRSAEVIDYVGGVADLESRVLRTIGDPLVRFAEDPVRMLRAVKFISRLGLSPAPDVAAALEASAERIELSAPPRVLEEIFKLMSCGHSGTALTQLLDYGLLQRLLPEVAGYWSQHRDELTATGAALDRIDRGQRGVSNAYLLAVLCLRPWRAEVAERPQSDPLLVAHELFDPAALRMSIPRRDITGMRQLLVTQLRLEGRRRSRRFRMRDFLARPSTEEALQLLHLASRAGYADPETHAEWMQRLAGLAPEERPAHAGRADAEGDADADADAEGEGEGAGEGEDDAERAQRPEGRPAGGGEHRRRRRRRGGRRHRARRERETGSRPSMGPSEPSPEQAAGDEAGAGPGLEGPPSEPRPADGGENGEARPGRRRRRRGGRRHRGRQRERHSGGDAPGDGASAAAQPQTQEPERQGGEPREQREPREPREPRERSAGRGRREGRRGRRGGGRSSPRPETDAGRPDDSLSPARPSKASEPVPGSRLKDNPENVEDLFDW